MAHIYSIQVGDDTYLIEPHIYTTAAGTGEAYTASISNYEITTNTVLFLTVPINNLANVTLTINGGSALPIYYQNSAIQPNSLKANQTYILAYAEDKWHVLNNLSGGGSMLIDANGGLDEGNNGLKIKSVGIINDMIANETIENNKLKYSSITIANQSVSLGGSLTLADLGLAQVLHFKGIAQNTTLTTGSKLDPFIESNPGIYQGVPGDIAIDAINLREYIWGDEIKGWVLLGDNLTSYKILQPAVIDPTANGATNTFIDSITQDANGVITATKKSVLGWQYNRKIYTDLTNNSQQAELNGAVEDAQALGIGVSGILPVNNGGTGASESAWSNGGILYGLQNENIKSYSSITGLRHQILTSGGSSAPIWTAAGFLESNVDNTVNQTNFTTLELGNEIDISNANEGHSEGRIVLYSAGIKAHLIRGIKADNEDYTHYLPNATGYILSSSSLQAVGSETQPIYINANGIATPITYTPHRLYYSGAAVNNEDYTENFLPSNHYADANKIGIKINTWPSNNNDVLYVNGTSSFKGIVTILDDTDITTGNNSTAGALIVNGGVTIYKQLFVNTSAVLNNTLTVNNTSTLINNVGIGSAPDNSETDNHRLLVNGSILITKNSDKIAHLDIDYDDDNHEVLFFIPENSGYGFIGTNTTQWASASFSDLITVGNGNNNVILNNTGYVSINNGDSSIYLTTIDDNDNEVGQLIITADSPTIVLSAGNSSSSYTTWTVTNTSQLTITNDDETVLVGNENGWQLLSHVGIGIAPDNTDEHTLIINGSTLFVQDNTQMAHLDIEAVESQTLEPVFRPETSTYGYLGLSSYKWKEAYLSHILNISQTDSSFVVTIDDSNTSNRVATATLTSSMPTIELNTIDNTSDWIIRNITGILSITNTSQAFIGDDNGFYLNSSLYINNNQLTSPLPSNNYNLYVNGTTFHTGNITFIEATQSQTTSPSICWSGGTETVSLYYKINSSSTTNYLVIHDNKANIDNEMIYINASTPSIYPASDGTGSLGLTTNRWSAVYIGTNTTYGDAYTPIYWLNGVPTTMTIVQKVPWSLANTHKSCKIEHSMFTSNSIIIQIVVTSGESNLNAPLTWKSNTGYITINTAVGVSGTVEGYALVIRGEEYEDNTFTYTRTTSTV